MASSEFEEFFRQNQNTVFRIIRSYVRERDTAMDILMETMYAVYQRWERVRNFDNRTGYTVRVGINRAKKHLVKSRVASAVRFFRENEEHEISSNVRDPEKTALHNEEDGWLMSEIDKLKEVERNIIILKDMDSKKFEEIADLFGMKLPTVKSLYRRAKIKLSEKWEAKYGV
jgi:RNA polymerase sigma factor (sigma-70 family)